MQSEQHAVRVHGESLSNQGLAGGTTALQKWQKKARKKKGQPTEKKKDDVCDVAAVQLCCNSKLHSDKETCFQIQVSMEN